MLENTSPNHFTTMADYTLMQNMITQICKKDKELTEIHDWLTTPNNNYDLSTRFTLITNLAFLKDRMKEDVVHFRFTKSDGTTREAYGTRATDIINSGSATPNSNNGHSPSTFPYYDIERRAWRSFSVTRFIETDNSYTL